MRPGSGAPPLRPPAGALVGPSGRWPSGPVARPVPPPSVRRRGLLRCARPRRPLRAALRPLALVGGGLRPRPPGFAPPPAASPLRSLGVAPVGSGCRRLASPVARLRAPPPRPVPMARLRAGRAGCGPLVGGRPWPAPCVPAGRPARLCGLPRPLPGPRGAPLRSAPCGALAGPSGGRPSGPPGLLPPGGAGGPAGRLFRPAPPGVLGLTRAGCPGLAGTGCRACGTGRSAPG